MPAAPPGLGTEAKRGSGDAADDVILVEALMAAPHQAPDLLGRLALLADPPLLRLLPFNLKLTSFRRIYCKGSARANVG